MDGTYRFPSVFYRTLSPLVPSGAAALPCLPDSKHHELQEQGKGTDDHLLPLGDWLFMK